MIKEKNTICKQLKKTINETIWKQVRAGEPCTLSFHMDKNVFDLCKKKYEDDQYLIHVRGINGNFTRLKTMVENEEAKVVIEVDSHKSLFGWMFGAATPEFSPKQINLQVNPYFNVSVK